MSGRNSTQTHEHTTHTNTHIGSPLFRAISVRDDVSVIVCFGRAQRRRSEQIVDALRAIATERTNTKKTALESKHYAVQINRYRDCRPDAGSKEAIKIYIIWRLYLVRLAELSCSCGCDLNS